MTVFADMVLVVSALIVSYLLFSVRSKKTPEVFLHKVSYDPNSNKIRLTLENYGDKPLHVKPAFRLVHLKSAEEWKNGVSEDGVPMMTGREMSLIKGYELLSQFENPVEVPSQKIHEIEANLPDDCALQAYDNVRVSMLCGFDPGKLMDAVHSTLRVRIDESIEQVPAVEMEAPAAAAEGAEKLSIRKRFARNGFPLEATCVCCGQIKWLKWIVDGQHVCVDCRDFLYDRIKVEYPQEELEPKLSGRQKKIVDLLTGDRKVTIKELSALVGQSRTTVSKEVKALVEMGVVSSKKEKNRQFYVLT
jgi:DNA-binding transcriptional ArsR family regulator